ncbi:unnamed protein product [Phaeothamnion confervicola]
MGTTTPSLQPRASALPLMRHANVILDEFSSFEAVQDALREKGLESSNLIIGVDFTKSNEWTGKRSFDGRCMHDVAGPGETPYEQVLRAVSQTLEPFDDDHQIPCYGFGDVRTGDHSVFSFQPDDAACYGLAQVVRRYRDVASLAALSGPTSFAPLIDRALEIVVSSRNSYHILVIVADGQVSSFVEGVACVTDSGATSEAIVRASSYPLSIVAVGVGDGPWDEMVAFDDELPDRIFDNFQFVEFNRVQAEYGGGGGVGPALAMHCLMECPEQFLAIRRLRLLGAASPQVRPPTRIVDPPEDLAGLDPFWFNALPEELKAEALENARRERDEREQSAEAQWTRNGGGRAAQGRAPSHDQRTQSLPEDYLCPITGDIMRDPVFTEDGHSYEREAIEDWLSEHNTSPKTNLQLQGKRLAPNHSLRNAIQAFLAEDAAA